MFYEFTTAPPIRLQNYIVIVLKIGQDLPFWDLKLTFFSSFYLGPVHVHLSKFLISKTYPDYSQLLSRKNIQEKLRSNFDYFMQNIFTFNSCILNFIAFNRFTNHFQNYEFKFSCYFWPTKISFKILFCLLFCFFIINNLIG